MSDTSYGNSDENGSNGVKREGEHKEEGQEEGEGEHGPLAEIVTYAPDHGPSLALSKVCMCVFVYICICVVCLSAYVSE